MQQKAGSRKQRCEMEGVWREGDRAKSVFWGGKSIQEEVVELVWRGEMTGRGVK